MSLIWLDDYNTEGPASLMEVNGTSSDFRQENLHWSWLILMLISSHWDFRRYHGQHHRTASENITTRNNWLTNLGSLTRLEALEFFQTFFKIIRKKQCRTRVDLLWLKLRNSLSGIVFRPRKSEECKRLTLLHPTVISWSVPSLSGVKICCLICRPERTGIPSSN